MRASTSSKRGDYYSADVTMQSDGETYDEREMDVLGRSVISQFEQYVKLNKKVPPEVLTALAASSMRVGSPIPWLRICP